MNRMKFLLLFYFLSGCTSTLFPKALNYKRSVYYNAVFFGDSVTERENGYAVRVASDLGWRFSNQAVGGTQLSQQLKKALSVGAKSYDVAVILVGYNDYRFNGSDQKHLIEFTSDLQAMLSHFQAVGVDVYVGDTLRMYPDWYVSYPPGDKGSDAAAKLYADAIKKVVREFPRAYLVNVNAEFEPKAEYFDDKVHPSDLGATVLAKIFEKQIWRN